MALDPVLQQLIDQLPTVPPGPVDYPSLRQQAAAMIPLIIGPEGRIEVASVEDRQIEAGGEIVPLRIYRPATEAVGTLHYIHGGGCEAVIECGGKRVLGSEAIAACNDNHRQVTT